ncbi:ATP synthase F1 subunit delta [Tanticharoenia sakaeratensis]|uniref:ATP synthase subunit delta n=1 Tax=Tanticharoenia sakaeratensis NBRC 103193 TaxID=1231623 RepID=A0A0D6MMK9_9PROT|nr:ATP synthase F1 subunit delta [Tanticharoenia sakaeratensis]GAN54518.1 ATP synthase delta chain [Tanticharoenia sakaeratensis NBRC 103193]GBQ23839.1 ATP synthase F1 subunit delta [Tanticharoenia sakaeratensis NBRC 103193]
MTGTASSDAAPQARPRVALSSLHGVPARYATALYEFADERSSLPEVLRQAETLATLIDEDVALRSFIGDRAIDARAGGQAIDAVLEARGFGDTLRHFVGVIARNRRLSRLRDILAAVSALAAKRRGEVVAEVRTAQPLSEQQRATLATRLSEAGYGRVAVTEIVEPELLGGLVVQIGAHLFDTSLRGRLTRLSHAMKGAA